MKTKKLWILLGFLLFISVFFPSFPTTAQTTVTPSGFWVRSGDVVCFEVLQASINDTDGIPVWDTFPSPILNASDYVTFIPKNIPDWATDPFESMNYTIFIDGFVDFFHLTSAPWEMNYIEVDGPPAFTPLLPIGDNNYWNNLKTEFEDQGFQVIINTTSDTFHYEYSDANLSVSADYLMSTGALNYYDATINSYEEGELYVMKFTFQLYVVFAPSQAALQWAFNMPLLDYSIIQAGYPNGTQGLQIMPSDDGEHNPVWGEGYIYPNQLLSVDIEELPVLPVDDINYLAHFMTDTGRFEFNITLDIPKPYPQENNSGFLYPLLPVITDDLARVIRGVAFSLGTNYSVEMTDDWIVLEYSDGQRMISANWIRTTGVLTHYYYMENPSGDYPGMVIEIELAVTGDLANYDFHWGEEEGAIHYYKVDQAMFGNNFSIPVDDENENLVGYLNPGDLLEVKAIDFSSLEEGPSSTYELKNLNESWTTTIHFEIERPGHVNSENGPPYLYFHFLAGSEISYAWFSEVMNAAGATVTFGKFTGNLEHDEMRLTWDYYVNGNKGFSLEAIWNKSNAVLTYYSLEYWGNVMEGPDGQYIKLALSLIPETAITSQTTTNTTETTETTPIFLDAPQILVFSLSLALIALSIKKIKIKI